MDDAYVQALGLRYQVLMRQARTLCHEITEAIDAVHRGEVDCAFGRELVAALGNLEAMPDAMRRRIATRATDGRSSTDGSSDVDGAQ